MYWNLDKDSNKNEQCNSKIISALININITLLIKNNKKQPLHGVFH